MPCSAAYIPVAAVFTAAGNINGILSLGAGFIVVVWVDSGYFFDAATGNIDRTTAAAAAEIPRNAASAAAVANGHMTGKGACDLPLFFIEILPANVKIRNMIAVEIENNLIGTSDTEDVLFLAQRNIAQQINRTAANTGIGFMDNTMMTVSSTESIRFPDVIFVFISLLLYMHTCTRIS